MTIVAENISDAALGYLLRVQLVSRGCETHDMETGRRCIRLAALYAPTLRLTVCEHHASEWRSSRPEDRLVWLVER